MGSGLAASACAKSPVISGKSATPTPSASSSAEPRVERIVVTPEQIAEIGAADSEKKNGAMPAVIVLGKSSESARLFLRFSIRLPKNGVMRSANLLLSRTDDVDMAMAPVELHAARVIDAWDARSITWPFQPRVEEAHAPHTTVSPASAKIVRIDVRSIVQDWPLRDPADQGIAVLSDRENSTGLSFAYMTSDAPPPELEILWAFSGAPPVENGASPAIPSMKPNDKPSEQKRMNGVNK